MNMASEMSTATEKCLGILGFIYFFEEGPNRTQFPTCESPDIPWIYNCCLSERLIKYFHELHFCLNKCIQLCHHLSDGLAVDILGRSQLVVSFIISCTCRIIHLDQRREMQWGEGRNGEQYVCYCHQEKSTLKLLCPPHLPLRKRLCLKGSNFETNFQLQWLF